MANKNLIHACSLIIVMIAALFMGCKKDDPVVISGLILDPNQQIPVEGVTVEVWTQQIEGGIFAANYKLAATFITLQDGKFLFNLESLNYTGIRLIFKKEGYFGWESDINMDKVKTDHGHHAQYQLLPKALLHIRVVNAEPFNADDFFEFRILNGFSTCEECCKAEKYQYSGMNIDQTVECQTAGHLNLVIQWSKRKNGEQVFKTETIFVKAFETTDINFNY